VIYIIWDNANHTHRMIHIAISHVKQRVSHPMTLNTPHRTLVTDKLRALVSRGHFWRSVQVSTAIRLVARSQEQRPPAEPAVDNLRLSVREGVVKTAAMDVAVEVHKALG
jgi:hypothetical protein